jgi:hypothetical protein
MQHISSFRWSLTALGVCVMGLLSPVPGSAEAVSGQARAVQAIVAVSGSLETTTLADTGTLGGATDAREASEGAGSVSSMLSAEALHAATIGWTDQVSSEASVANLALAIGDTTITADFAMARIIAGKGADYSAATIEGLVINGVAIDVTGSRNQRVDFPGGTVVINEQSKGSSGTAVNALHITIDGTADVVIAAASAKAQ